MQFNRPDLVFSDAALAQLRHYSWPGNVRELHHVVERACLLCSGNSISAEDLQITLAPTPGSGPDPGPNSGSSLDTKAEPPSDHVLAQMTLDEAERWLIELHLARQDGNAALVAKTLGISRSGIYRRLEKYGIKYR